MESVLALWNMLFKSEEISNRMLFSGIVLMFTPSTASEHSTDTGRTTLTCLRGANFAHFITSSVNI